MCRSATKIDKTFWSANRFKLLRTFISAMSIRSHVRVEAYHGEADNGGIKNPSVTILNPSGRNGDGSYVYQGSVPGVRKRRLRIQRSRRSNPSAFDASARAAPDHLVVAPSGRGGSPNRHGD